MKFIINKTKSNKAIGGVVLLLIKIKIWTGVDVKSLYRVVHFGPPPTISAYIQESGRAGRDGGATDVTLIKYSGKFLVSLMIGRPLSRPLYVRMYVRASRVI